MKKFLRDEPYNGTIADAAREYGVKIPSDFMCPITLDVMVNPLMSRHGHSFERDAILEWISNGTRQCPLTRKPVRLNDFVPNSALEMKIWSWMWENDLPLPNQYQRSEIKSILVISCPSNTTDSSRRKRIPNMFQRD